MFKKKITLKGEMLRARKTLKAEGKVVDTSMWQAMINQFSMYEIMDYKLRAPIPATMEQLAEETGADLPWAEEHFQERVCGNPLNPAPSFIRWPYYRDDNKWRPGGIFPHTYPERMWTPGLEGIRYRYGNLQDVVSLLYKHPDTRQAYLPLWFPEDTGAHHGERVPCTLGYYFILRDGKLNMFYPIRSCDFRRHFHNDVYMAGRLLQWMLEVLRGMDIENEQTFWSGIKPGTLFMDIWNLHIFDGEQDFI